MQSVDVIRGHRDNRRKSVIHILCLPRGLKCSDLDLLPDLIFLDCRRHEQTTNIPNYDRHSLNYCRYMHKQSKQTNLLLNRTKMEQSDLDIRYFKRRKFLHKICVEPFQYIMYSVYMCIQMVPFYCKIKLVKKICKQEKSNLKRNCQQLELQSFRFFSFRRKFDISGSNQKIHLQTIETRTISLEVRV